MSYTTPERDCATVTLRTLGGRRFMARLNAIFGLLLLTFDGLSMTASFCCLTAAVLYLLIGLGEESAEDVEAAGAEGRYTGPRKVAASNPRRERLDWTVVDGAYLRPRPNRRFRS